jgi:hypothetical protein
MSTLNRLPDGTQSPRFKCVAESHWDREVKTVVLQEWWYDYKRVESIHSSAKSYFYEAFRKCPSTIVSITKEPVLVKSVPPYLKDLTKVHAIRALELVVEDIEGCLGGFWELDKPSMTATLDNVVKALNFLLKESK